MVRDRIDHVLSFHFISMKRTVAAFVLLSLLFVTGCESRQEQAWRQALKQLTLELKTIPAPETDWGKADTLFLTGPSIGHTIKLPEYPESTEYHKSKEGDESTIALYYSYWAGSGGVTRVRRDGYTLFFEHMGVAEPTGESEGIMCEPWEVLREISLNEGATITTEPNRAPLEYRSEFDCDCQENPSGDGYLCRE